MMCNKMQDTGDNGYIMVQSFLDPKKPCGGWSVLSLCSHLVLTTAAASDSINHSSGHFSGQGASGQSVVSSCVSGHLCAGCVVVIM